MKSAVDHILDIRGMIIPVTFLRITQALREMTDGETIEVIGNDPETKKDLSKILQTFSYEVLNINKGKNVYRILLRKGRPGDKSFKPSL